MKIPITYAEAKQRHPQEVAAAVRALRASSSKHKQAALSKIEWEYSIAVKVEGFSMAEIRSGAVRKRMEERAKMTWDARIDEQLGNSTAVLHAHLERWSHSSPQLPNLPPEWVKNVRDEFRKSREEQEAYAALPETEKETRRKAALDAAKQAGGGGFFALTVPEDEDPSV